MDSNKSNHQETLTQLLLGDEKAFDRLFKQFYPGLLRYAKALIPYPSDEAEDIISDVFCNLWVNREKIIITGSVASYLYRSVKNRIINTHKKGKLNLTDIEDAPYDIADQSHQVPDKLMAYKQFNEHINSLISRLPEKTRLVFLMSRDEGLTYEEIAEVMDVTINTIKTHMFRAIRFLKEACNTNDYINLLIVGVLCLF